MNLSKFAERLSELMFDKQLNGLALSEKVGCGANTIYRYLQGERTPSVEIVIILADFFKCSTDFLLGLEDENYTQRFEQCPPFSVRLPVVLEKCNKTQYYVEKKTGISHSTMGYWKNGKKKPTIESIIKIAKVLDCSIDYLLGRTKD